MFWNKKKKEAEAKLSAEKEKRDASRRAKAEEEIYECEKLFPLGEEFAYLGVRLHPISHRDIDFDIGITCARLSVRYVDKNGAFQKEHFSHKDTLRLMGLRKAEKI